MPHSKANFHSRFDVRSHSVRYLAAIPVLLIGFLTMAGWASAAEGESKHPNIVFIMADDLGYGDPSCYNADSKIPTPNIDRLAHEGMRFTDAHAPAALCVPTRFGLLTGLYPMRMSGGKGEPRIEAGRLTLGSLLQQHGYRTACVGKWHLGFDITTYSEPLRSGPVDRGFDEYFGIHASLDIPPYYYIENDHCVEPPTETIGGHNSEGVKKIQGAFWRAGDIAPHFKHAEVLPTFFNRAVVDIDQHEATSPGKPLFLYLALPSPHTPWLPNESVLGKSQAGDYGDYTVQVDQGVGRVLDALDQTGLADNTLVIFTSDNGPVWFPEDIERYNHRSSGPLRGKKAEAWEGGHRMPFLARWPGKIPAGTVSDEVICHTDMLATFAAIVGDTLPDDAGEDSYNVLPALLGEQGSRPIREATVHQAGSAPDLLAIRQGPWKLILGPDKSLPKDAATKVAPVQLYRMDVDLAETNNVWDKHPDIVERLTALVKQYQQTGRSVRR